jgi:hypothetical protein
MKKLVSLLTVLTFFLVSSLYAQTIDDTINTGINKPKVEIKVNKVYDENGNVIEYDSVYTWSYSNSTGNVRINIDPDSLFRQFIPWFGEHLNAFSNPFSSKVLNDSTMYLDFFNNDHFFDQWQDELFDFRNEMRRMDSLKRVFFDKFLKEAQIEQDRDIKTY